MKLQNFRGDLTDIFAIKEPLPSGAHRPYRPSGRCFGLGQCLVTSASVLEIKLNMFMDTLILICLTNIIKMNN